MPGIPSSFTKDEWQQSDPGLVVGRLVPDLVRHDGLRLCVDVHGDYWHRHDTPKDVKKRQRVFARHGHILVVVWEREFKRDPNVVVRRVLRAEERG